MKLKAQEEFAWIEEHQLAFNDIKQYLAQPSILVPPRQGVPLQLYLSMAEDSIGSLLVQDNEKEIE